MFTDTKVFSAFAVDDLSRARKFYGETLGVPVSEQHGLLTLHLAGGRDTRVYPKPDHTAATYTILMFQVDDIEAAVGAGQRLFEHVDTSVLHFRLTDERRLENGSVILTYVPSDLSA
jgi:catechol 2,3-dioxygenase-like lactoylglutathione lyase family enzyme